MGDSNCAQSQTHQDEQMAASVRNTAIKRIQGVRVLHDTPLLCL